jgi:hypothetical protein
VSAFLQADGMTNNFRHARVSERGNEMQLELIVLTIKLQSVTSVPRSCFDKVIKNEYFEYQPIERTWRGCSSNDFPGIGR